MVDTPRTLAEILALLPDNTTREISEQDVRDVVVSIADPIAGGGFPAAWAWGGQLAALPDVYPGLFTHDLGAALRVEHPTADGSAFPVALDIEERATWADGTDVYAYLESASFVLDTAGFTQQVQQLFGAIYVIGDGDVGDVFGQEATLYQKGNGDVGNVIAVWGNFSLEGTGTTTHYEALRADMGYYPNGGDLTTGYGLHVRGPSLAGGSTIGTAYGVYIDTMDEAGVTADWNLYSAGATSKHRIEGKLAVGSEADIDSPVITSYFPASIGHNVATAADGVVPDRWMEAAIGARIVYDRTASFGGSFAPTVTALALEAVYDPSTGVTDVNDNDLVGVFGTARLATGAAMAPFLMYGGELGVVVEEDAPTMTTDVAGMFGTVVLMGDSPGSPGSAWYAGVKAVVNVGDRTGTYKAAGVYVPASGGSGNPTEMYGVYIAAVTKGSAQSWSLFAAGSAAKSKIEGTLYVEGSGGRTLINGFGAVVYTNPADANYRIGIFRDAGPGATPGFALGAGGATAPDVNLYRLAANVLKTDDKLIAVAGLGVGNSAAATTPGSVTRKIEVFDAAGTSLGFVPVYDAIT